MNRPLFTQMIALSVAMFFLSAGVVKAKVASDDGKKHAADLNDAHRKLIALKMHANEHQAKARAIEKNSTEVLPGHETMDMSELVQEVEEIKKMIESVASKLNDMQSDDADAKIEHISTTLNKTAKKINKKKRELNSRVRSSIGKRVVVKKPLAKPTSASAK